MPHLQKQIVLFLHHSLVPMVSPLPPSKTANTFLFSNSFLRTSASGKRRRMRSFLHPRITAFLSCTWIVLRCKPSNTSASTRCKSFCSTTRYLFTPWKTNVAEVRNTPRTRTTAADTWLFYNPWYLSRYSFLNLFWAALADWKSPHCNILRNRTACFRHIVFEQVQITPC